MLAEEFKTVVEVYKTQIDALMGLLLKENERLQQKFMAQQEWDKQVKLFVATIIVKNFNPTYNLDVNKTNTIDALNILQHLLQQRLATKEMQQNDQ